MIGNEVIQFHRFAREIWEQVPQACPIKCSFELLHLFLVSHRSLFQFVPNPTTAALLIEVPAFDQRAEMLL